MSFDNLFHHIQLDNPSSHHKDTLFLYSNVGHLKFSCFIAAMISGYPMGGWRWTSKINPNSNEENKSNSTWEGVLIENEITMQVAVSNFVLSY